ncbi:AraC family transcriptional regulator [Paenibacillus whitsoniae]|uniref:AraC family transcriptional regulator n=1 Tax=Paenibacillus whitsoniae TaxID=2496558 RepID=A0A430J8N6_9BACL|nr:AraC family transcriptional regulator [Paenibacillus whitsoniae]RTE06474.1 AraC family transcriptional regulator [Paenibacillus whitsoniae]
MMPFLLAELLPPESALPLHVYCVGSHEQKQLYRPEGFPAHQLFLSRNGRGIFRIAGGRELSMSPGSILLLPAGVHHEYYPEQRREDWELGFVAFNGTAAEAMLTHVSCGTPMACADEDFQKLWNKLEGLWQCIHLDSENGDGEASRRMYDMLIAVMESRSGREVRARVHPPGQANGALREAVKLIHDHYNEGIQVSNLARAVGYSVQHFNRLFTASYGVSPQQYIQQMRMRRSVQLFEEQPGMTIDEVAQQMGMETSYFIRMFKRTYGYTPKQWLKHVHTKRPM